MPRHLRTTCPRCQRPDLPIRPEHIGRGESSAKTVAVFRHRPPADAPDVPAVREFEGDTWPRAGPKEEVRGEREAPVADDSAAVPRFEESEGKMEQSQRRLAELERSLATAIAEHEAVRTGRDAERELAEGAEADRIDLQRLAWPRPSTDKTHGGRTRRAPGGRDPVLSRPARRSDRRPARQLDQGCELSRQLRLAQEANERLRSFLAVFGPHDEEIGTDAR